MKFPADPLFSFLIILLYNHFLMAVRAHGVVLGADNSNVLAASLDLGRVPDPEQIGELLDFVDAAAPPVKSGALALLRRLASVYGNAATLIECCTGRSDSGGSVCV